MKKGLLIVLAVLLALAFIPALAEESAALKMGDSGEEVLELNTRLRQLNYTTVRASDQYTEATQAAVSAMQEAYGLPGRFCTAIAGVPSGWAIRGRT